MPPAHRSLPCWTACTPDSTDARLTRPPPRSRTHSSCCATRQQVMAMLDRLYAGFDRLASTLGVFKVETIGAPSPSPACGLATPP